MLTMEDSVFTKIIKGEIPSNKVYEDDKNLVITPLHMLGKGHLLVIPKVQVETIWDLIPEDYQSLMGIVQKTGQKMREVLKTKKIGVQVVGLDVPHAHVHVVAFDSIQEFHTEPDPTVEPDFPALSAMAEKLKFE